ncbi:outer membrane protein assembly factor BamE [Yoonia sediminilitoris]|uniref:Beta-barrel assembly machine subunit BamE n=1 Tax=Yoonia sediminilitoris TaxID=1286148 RepID=A0A2T6KRN5_9RHOB|nr:outer membrane protein assembly factor BamE [Yoonia sediminilitoris]PUB19224.1 Beta-barrel assembly machine subunit BamE [Yoonia sediminilitoris]RCW99392.1 Beta-barrel assembly machine subunit BamE [Yoonia sediminilitoris]
MTPGMRKTTLQLRVCAWVAAALFASGCTPINRYHGFTPSQAELAEVQVGQTTRDTIVSNFGPPTSQGVPGGDSYYYVSSQFRHFGAFAPQEVSREVLAIRFTPQGVVRNVERFTLEDGQVVALDRRVTDDGINDVTVLGQLLNSLGRIDAGQLFGGDSEPEF